VHRSFRPTAIARIAALFAALAVLAFSLAVPASASAEEVPLALPTPVPVAADHDPERDPLPQGFTDIFGPDTVAAAAEFMRVEGVDTIRVFCVENGVPFPSWDPAAPPSPLPSTEYVGAAWSVLRQGTPANMTHVSWLVRHLTYTDDGGPAPSPVGAPLTEEDGFTAEQLVAAEAAASQLAVWNMLDGTDLASVPNEALRARASQLAELATEETQVELPHAFAAAVAVVSPSEATRVVQVAVSQATGSVPSAAAVGVPVTVAVPADSGVDLDPAAEGVQSEVTLTSGADGRASSAPFAAPGAAVPVQATALFTLQPGTLLTGDGTESQQVVTIDGALVARTAAADIAPFVAPNPTTPPTTPPTTSPQPTPPTPPAGGGGQLPYTGGWVSLPVVLGAGALGAAGLWLRRRGASL
jgi:hypothetical protein